MTKKRHNLFLWCVVLAMALSGNHAMAQSASWYYCDPLKAYFPHVQNCPVPWREVAPTTPENTHQGSQPQASQAKPDNDLEPLKAKVTGPLPIFQSKEDEIERHRAEQHMPLACKDDLLVLRVCYANLITAMEHDGAIKEAQDARANNIPTSFQRMFELTAVAEEKNGNLPEVARACGHSSSPLPPLAGEVRVRVVARLRGI